MAELGRRLRAPRRGRRAALLASFGMITSVVATSVPAVVEPVAAASNLRVTAWAPYWEVNDALPRFNANTSQLSELTPFFWSATSATTIVRNTAVSANQLTQYKNAATAAGKPFVATIVDGMGARGMTTVLSTPEGRAAHVLAITNFVLAGGFTGVDIDYEQFAFADGRSSWPATYDYWGAFLTELNASLDAQNKGLTLAVSVPPIYNSGTDNTSSGYWVYNYAALATQVDKVRIMTYSYSGNAAGVVSPYWWVEQSMLAAKAIVPADKIEMGIAAYGTDVVNKVEGTCPVNAGVKQSRSITHADAAQFAASKGVTPAWVEKQGDKVVKEATFTYVESFGGVDASGYPVRCNVTRVVWYPNQQAINERVLLARNLDLGGVAMWALGYDDAVTWQAIAAGRAGATFAQPAPLTPNVKAPAVVAPYPAPITSPVSALPARYLDTRPNARTTDSLFAGKGRVEAGGTIEVKIAGRGTVAQDVTAVTLNVTAIGEGNGFVTVYPCGERPTTSNLNVRTGQIISNSVITKLSPTGTVCLYSQQPAHLIVDVFNVLPDAAFTPTPAPARLLDTRDGEPTVDGLASGGGLLQPGTVLQLPVAGRGGVSATATTAVLNVTADGAVGKGFLTVWPCGAPQPATSNVNYPAGSPIPNAVVTGIGNGGAVCISTLVRTHVIVDAFGAMEPGSYVPLATPGRLLDTRVGGPTIDGGFSGDDIQPAGSVIELQVSGRAGVPTGAKSAVLNVTVDGPTASGFLTVYPCGTARPLVSNVNFAAGQILPNLVVTSLSSTGTVCIYNLVPTHVVVDVFGSLTVDTSG